MGTLSRPGQFRRIQREERIPMGHKFQRAAAVFCTMAAAAVIMPQSAWADGAGTPDNRAADELFGYSYGESSSQSAKSSEPIYGANDGDPRRNTKPGTDALELEFRGSDETQFFEADARRGTREKQFGIAGTGTGASLLGLGGISYVGSLFLDKGSTERKVFSYGGLALMGVGGALFITGAIFLLVDMGSTPPKHPIPAPTADGKGAQLIFTTTF